MSRRGQHPKHGHGARSRQPAPPPPQPPAPPPVPAPTEWSEVARAESAGGKAAAGFEVMKSFNRGWKAKRTQGDGYQREQQRLMAQYGMEMTAYRRLVNTARAKVMAGATMVLGGSAVVIGEVATGGDIAGPGPAAAVAGIVIAGIGGVAAYRGQDDQKELAPPEQPILPMPPPPPLPKHSPGSAAAESIAGSRNQLVSMLPTVERLHPQAAEELRRADAQASPIMAALVERIRHLLGVRQQMPDTQAAHMAGVSINSLAEQLAVGARTYDELLASVVQLISAASPVGDELLRPSINELTAYTAGLQRVADTW